VEIAAESLRLAEVGYREGVNVQLDVLEARTRLTEARQELASALKNYRLYRARLWRAEGSLRENVLDR
jgi:outer membrane protein TolC